MASKGLEHGRPQSRLYLRRSPVPSDTYIRQGYSLDKEKLCPVSLLSDVRRPTHRLHRPTETNQTKASTAAIHWGSPSIPSKVRGSQQIPQS